jgi:hypothetical protein
LLEQLPDEEVLEEAGTLLARESVKKAEDFVKPKAKKLREKIQLREATEALEEQNADTNKAKAASAKTKTKKAKLELVEDNDVPEVVESAPNDKKAKKTRKTKLVDFEIVEEK